MRIIDKMNNLPEPLIKPEHFKDISCPDSFLDMLYKAQLEGRFNTVEEGLKYILASGFEQPKRCGGKDYITIGSERGVSRNNCKYTVTCSGCYASIFSKEPIKKCPKCGTVCATDSLILNK